MEGRSLLGVVERRTGSGRGEGQKKDPRLSGLCLFTLTTGCAEKVDRSPAAPKEKKRSENLDFFPTVLKSSTAESNP